MDLEKSSLEIKTDSEQGSTEKVIVKFYSSDEKGAGGITLIFAQDMAYRIRRCMNDQVEFPIDVPTETNKVWRITLSRPLGVRRVAIHCNEVEVLNLSLKASRCNQRDWMSYWERDVAMIEFDSIHTGTQDTASDFYRQAPGQPIIVFFSEQNKVRYFWRGPKVQKRLTD